MITSLDKKITDQNFIKYFKSTLKPLMIIVLALSLLIIPVNPYVTINSNGSAFAISEPVKISVDRGSETWQLPDGSFVFKAGGEATTNTFDNSTNTWVPYILTDLGGNDFEVQTGRITTSFIGEIITHFDSNMTTTVGTEKIRLMLDTGTFVEQTLTLVSRTASIILQSISETVAGITVTDTNDKIEVLENWSTAKGNLLVNYTFVEGKPLKHTFSFTQTTSGTENYRLYHEFNLIEEEIELESQGKTVTNVDKIKLQVKQDRIFFKIIFINGTEIEQETETILAIDKATFSDILQRFQFTKQLDSGLILTEIVAPSTTDPAFIDFIELFIDVTSDPIFQFRYGNYTVSQGQSFELDPDTYSENNPTEDGHVIDQSNNDVCDTASSSNSGSTVLSAYGGVDSSVNDCRLGFVEWDTSSIPAGSTITNTVFKFAIAGVQNPQNCDYVDMGTVQPSVASDATIIAEIILDNDYLNNDATCVTVANDVEVDLGTGADADLPASFFALGLKPTSLVSQASTNEVDFSSEENSNSPDPTLEVTYTSPAPMIPIFYENDASTLVTTGDLIVTNTTGTFIKAVNSTGQEKFMTQGGSLNVTMKETTDNFVVNQTINYTPSGYDLWGTPSAGSFIFDVNCSSNGAGNDVTIMINGTDGHHITSFGTPSCNTNDEITWAVTFTANGKLGTSYNSDLYAKILNTTGFGINAERFAIDGTTTTTTYASDTITASDFSVGTGLTTVTHNYYLRLADIRNVPYDVDYNNGTAFTGGTLIQTNSSSSNNSFSLDSGGQFTITGLNSLQNVTVKDADNYVVDRDLNYNVTSANSRDLNTDIFTISCTDNGAGNDLEIKINQTNAHYISSYDTTPTCSASNVIYFNATFTPLDGVDIYPNWHESILHVRILNETHFGADASAFTFNGTTVSTSYSEPVITSSVFAIGQEATTRTDMQIILSLTYLPSFPTLLATGVTTTTTVPLTWTAPDNAGNGTISSYRVDSSTGAGWTTETTNTGSSDTSYTVTGLTASTAYNFRVFTTNEVGTGGTSSSNASGTTTDVAGGGGGGGGGGGTGGASQIITGLLFAVDIFRVFHGVSLGDTVRDQNINVEWNTADDFKITRITAQSTPFTIIFQSTPLVLFGDSSGKSKGDIMYSFQVPEKACEDIQKDDCVFFIKYVIPVAIIGEVNDQTVQENTTIEIDLTSDFDVVLYVIIGFIGVIVVGLGATKFKHPEHKKHKASTGNSKPKKSGSARKSIKS